MTVRVVGNSHLRPQQQERRENRGGGTAKVPRRSIPFGEGQRTWKELMGKNKNREKFSGTPNRGKRGVRFNGGRLNLIMPRARKEVQIQVRGCRKIGGGDGVSGPLGTRRADSESERLGKREN